MSPVPPAVGPYAFGIGASPMSSSFDGHTSYTNTPNTRFTAFSPQDARSGLYGVGRPRMTTVREVGDDPFVMDASRLQGQVRVSRPLSATASVFTPLAQVLSNDAQAWQLIQNVVYVNDSAPKDGTFTSTTPMSRLVKVSSGRNEPYVTGKLETGVAGSSLLDLISKGWGSIGRVDFKENESGLLLKMTHISDAVIIYKAIKERAQGRLCVDYLLPEAWAQEHGKEFTSRHEGEVLLQTVLPTGINRAVFEEEVLVVMRSEGDIVAWKVLSHPDATLHAMVVEFNDAERAQAVIAKLNNYAQPLGPPMNGQVRAAAVSMSLHWPDVIERQMIALNNEVAQDGASALHFGTAGTGQAPTNNMGMGAVVYGPAAAPTHQLQVPVHDVGSSRSVPNPYGHFGQVPPPFQSQAGHGPPEQRHRQLNHYNPRGRKHGKGYNGNPMFSPNDLPHNHVVCMAIEQGKDVRPTVMVRNIPNKMTLHQFMAIINSIVPGLFDFAYLRIDFANGCNVGYAFINFLDPMDIVKLVKALGGQKWGHEYYSDKICQISYATVQGREGLIAKFRNSSVMLEKEFCRPKLYFTYLDGRELCGKEEEFPEADNTSKLQRSCQNAEQTAGLFPPHAGQQVRAWQRGRRSNYDRGTPRDDMAALEDGSFYDQYDGRY